MNNGYSFQKNERLCSEKLIALLFRGKTNSLFQYPFKFIWVIHDHSSDAPAQILLSVSKKKFRRSHERNRIKRLMREVYRKNKSLFYDSLTSENKKALFLLSYIADKEISIDEMERNFLRIAERFVAQKH